MSRNDIDTKLKILGRFEAPPPEAEARARAVAASLAAFEAAQSAAPETEAAPSPAVGAQGPGPAGRLKSIVERFKGLRTMDMRIPLGTAAAALLLFPLGLHLVGTTSMTPFDLRVRSAAPVPAPDPEVAEAALPETRAPDSLAAQPAAGAAPLQPEPMADAFVPAEVAPPPAAPAHQAMDLARSMQSMPFAEPYMPVGPTASGDSFEAFEPGRTIAVAEQPVSTFSIDVDTASYAYVRRMLQDGQAPQRDAVRVEEMINYFPYDYEGPADAEVPFSTVLGIHPTPWNAGTQILHIGIKGYAPPAEERRPSNIVFLIDSSGSMNAPDKLPLLKRAFSLLIEQLGAEDTITIVTYAGSAGVVLEPTPASERARILSALDRLAAGGSTAGAEGIALAYQMAEQGFIEGGINRVILATDGDFNVGLSDPRGLEHYVAEKRDTGVFLSVLGFGMGNLRDDIMQRLAQNGNGSAHYISDFREAQKVLVEEMGATLETIAKDVKIQVEFNPAMVGEYRLIGYETRALNREDFNNDAVDAGEIGAGHTVTALYEITPAGSDAALIEPLRYGQAAAPAAALEAEEFAFLSLRYKLPDSETSRLYERAVTPEVVYETLEAAPVDMRFAAAVAAFGQKLAGSVSLGGTGWSEIRRLAQGARGEDESGYRAEFVQLVDLAAAVGPDRR